MTGGAERPFALSAAQERLVGEVRELAREVLAPLAAAGRAGRVNRGLVRALGEHGLLGRVLPAAPDGRGGASAMELCLLREALARESTEAETALALQGLGGYPVAVWGSSGVRGRFASRAGGGAGGGGVRAVGAGGRVGRGWAGAAGRTGRGGVPAQRDQGVDLQRPRGRRVHPVRPDHAGGRSRGITAFVVPGDAPGLGGEALELLAPHAIGRLELDGVRAGPEQVLGRVDQGFGVAMAHP